MKPVQYFSSEYLENCKNVKADEVLKFLDDFRQLHLSQMLQREIAAKTISQVSTASLESFKVKTPMQNLALHSAELLRLSQTLPLTPNNSSD